jgi:Tfp pilus assembly protein PilN
MRPINLIPLEERRGEQAPLRSGPLAYVLVGALVLLLVGVVALVLTGNQISEREDEVATLTREDAVAGAKAQRLAAYTQFRSLSEQRVQTVQSLADSRFDWERVMRELALVLPASAWLTELTASAGGGGAEGEGGGEGSLDALGPTLELSGCTTGQEATAGFVTALKDIDGVTRVGVQSSELPSKAESGGGGAGGESGGDECQTRNFIAKFEIVVAFDAAPVPSTEAEAEVAPESAPEAAQVAQSESSEGSSETTSASEGG